MNQNVSVLTTALNPIFEAYNMVLGDPQNRLRPPQLQFMVTSYEGVANKLPVIIEGPTGLGKTKALLAVAVAHINFHPEARVLYTTRTMPQLLNVCEDLEDLVPKWQKQIDSGKLDYCYGVYIGIGSMRRLFCQRFLPGITMDPEKLRSYRELLDDPERPEPCPDCEIRETRFNNSDIMSCHKDKYGVAEIELLLKNSQCPNPLMRSCATKASIILTSYPYLFNDFWKATIFGSEGSRKLCLPIIDEAHNIIETITESPALTICLTKDLQPGQGLDLSNNVYYLASLVDDLKYGYRRFILGHLDDLFRNAMETKRVEQRTWIEERSALLNFHKQACEEAKAIGGAIHELKESLGEIRSGKNSDISNPFISSDQIQSSILDFKNALAFASKRDKLIAERHELKTQHRQLCQQNSERKKERNRLHSEAKNQKISMSISSGTMRQMYYIKMKENYEEAKIVHDTMISSNADIEKLGKKIDELNVEIDDANFVRNDSFNKGMKLINEIFDELWRQRNDKSNQIEGLNLKIEKIQKEIDEYNNKLKEMDNGWRQLLNRIDENSDYRECLDDFYNVLQISVNDRDCWPEEMLKGSFSLFGFLVKFRDIFRSILSSLNLGPLAEAELGNVLRQLNEELGKEAGEDIPKFLERCENAVSEFETKMLQTRERWNGLPLYGLRQMFRILSLICQGPFGFAGIVGEAPLITFHSLDPAVRFRDVWHDLHPPILASATLSPVSDVAEVLGLTQGIKAKISPVFPSYNYQSYAFLGCHSSPAGNGEVEIFNKLEKEILKESIGTILKATKRHTGLFCASHKVLTALMKLLTKDFINKIGIRLLIARSDGITVNDDFAVLSQKCPAHLLKGMGEFDARLKLYMELAGKEPILLAGVTGGGLGEGVDFKGNTMEMAIIVGIPYQDEGDISWLNDRRTKFFKMRTGETEIGKDLAYRQSALRKIAQTAGRVHRTMKDRGAIIFFDERLLGLKNMATSGFARYEILSAANTKKHWEIIQTRIFEKLSVVIPPKFDKQEGDDLSMYIDRVFKERSPKPEIIALDLMIDSLTGFYNG